MTDADIAVFILARTAEREAKARAAIAGWVSQEWIEIDPEQMAHIALNDPAAVLARCAVDRQIVALHRLYDDRPYRGTPCCERCTAGGEYPADDAYTDEQNWPCPTLRALASLDADHPDYDKDWAP